MNYIIFSSYFVLVHVVSYFLAGMIAYSISKDLYQGKNRVLNFLVDPKKEGEAYFSLKKVLPAQILRGLLMSVVLYPLINFLSGFSFALRFLFFAGLMFIFTDLSSATPFPSNIEGKVYLKERYLQKNVFWKTQLEMLIYSIIFGFLIGNFDVVV